MKEAEKYYRAKFPKVKKLTLMDLEIIDLMQSYAKEEVEKALKEKFL